VHAAVKAEFVARGAHLVEGADRDRLAKALVREDGGINPAIVGQPAARIAEIAGFKVPAGAKVLLVEAREVGPREPFSQEKLSPVLALYRAADYDAACRLAQALVEHGGLGHTAALYTAPGREDRITDYGRRLRAGRVLINMPAAQGAIGDIYNFRLEPSLTLGCGSWGGNSVSENVGIRHLMNFQTIAERSVSSAVNGFKFNVSFWCDYYSKACN
jgi:acetaldehyde dehydrogenase/alcohol dehydrogenase